MHCTETCGGRLLSILLNLPVLAGLLLLVSTSGELSAADYPIRNIRIIAPSTPGGASDLTARVIAHGLSQRFGRPVVVENRPGASTRLGGEIVAKSEPDGYTLLIGISTLAILPSVFKNIPYDALKDFAPITQAVSVPNVFIVHLSLPAKSIKELIALAKRRPNEILFSSPGKGASAYLTIELFAAMTETRFMHVGYKSQAPALVAVLSGEVSMMSPSITTAIPVLRNKKVRPLGVTSLQRVKIFPDIPTIDEQGVRGFQSGNWFGLLAPAGTPSEIIKKLHTESVATLQSADGAKRLTSQGVEVVASSPDQFHEFIRQETVKWAKVARAAGIKPE